MRPGVIGLIELGGVIVEEAAAEDLASGFVVDGIIQRHEQSAIDSGIGNLLPEYRP